MPKDRKPAYGESPCVATAVRKASRRLSQLYDVALAPSGLRVTQYALLSELERRSKKLPTMHELADAMVMDRSALGHNLRPLERDGLIALEESKEDRRRRHVVITAQGRAKHREAKRLWQTAQGRFEEVYGNSEAAGLRAILLAIAHEERLATLHEIIHSALVRSSWTRPNRLN
jgi:DNA-binding MarR family transcriptional regulator